MRIMIYFFPCKSALSLIIMFSTDSIIPRIALSNKCSSLFCTIHLPPAEEGEFLLYYVKNNKTVNTKKGMIIITVKNKKLNQIELLFLGKM